MAKIKRVGGFEQELANEKTKAENAEKIIEEKIIRNDIAEIDIALIINPKKHDRVGYSETAISEFAENMKKVGQLQPIVVRVLPNGELERIIGFRRILAAKKLKWKKIKAVILENIDDDVAALMMLSENLHREDPNLYDQTIKIIEYVALSLNKTEDELKKLLFRLRNYEAGQLKDLSKEEKEDRDNIEMALEKTAKISIITLVDRLRVFNLDEKLIMAMREQGLSYANAIELNKIKDIECFENLFEKTISDKPSKNELKAWISECKLNNESTSPTNSNEDKLIQDVIGAIKKKGFKKINKQKQNQIFDYLKKIDELLKGSVQHSVSASDNS